MSKEMVWGNTFRYEITVQDRTETVDLCYYNRQKICT